MASESASATFMLMARAECVRGGADSELRRSEYVQHFYTSPRAALRVSSRMVDVSLKCTTDSSDRLTSTCMIRLRDTRCRKATRCFLPAIFRQGIRDGASTRPTSETTNAVQTLDAYAICTSISAHSLATQTYTVTTMTHMKAKLRRSCRNIGRSRNQT